MTKEQAKALGERALALGMPFRDIAGLMDGRTGERVGALSVADLLHNAYPDSWPDFRDPVTEAWLVVWAAKTAQEPGWYVNCRYNYTMALWTVEIGRSGVNIVIREKVRSEAWILAIEKLKGEG